MRFSSLSPRSARHRKSAFGGRVQPRAVVDALNNRIEAVEKRELDEFEKEFDQQAPHLWKKDN